MEFFGVILGTFEVFFIFGMFYYGAYGLLKTLIKKTLIKKLEGDGRWLRG